MNPRGRPFQPGNTFGQGRPQGSRNKTTKKTQELLDRYCEPITQKAIGMAIKGDSMALRLCMERLYPARRGGYVNVRLGKAQTVADLTGIHEQVFKAVANGQITPAEGETLSSILEDRRRLMETTELEARITQLEQSKAGRNEKRGNQ